MTNVPTFSEYWTLTTRVGFKERLAKRFHYLPTNHKIAIFEKVKALPVKPDPQKYLNIGKK